MTQTQTQKTGWDAGETTQSKFLDNFQADSVAAGYCEGTVTVDGKSKKTHQLFIIWQPRGVDENGESYKAQPAWYSMGQKPFVVGGEETIIEYGDEKQQVIYSLITSGPKLGEGSKMGQLVDRLKSLGWTVKGADAKVFIGIPATLVREVYDPDANGDINYKKEDKPDKKDRKKSKLDGESEILMPVEILKGGAQATIQPATSEQKAKKDSGGRSSEDLDDIETEFLNSLVGKKSEDIPAIVKNNQVLVAMNVRVAEAFRIVEKLVDEEKLKVVSGTYQK